MDEQPFRTINTLRKAGKLQEAWDFGCPAVQENPNDAYLKGAFFWVCYDYLKQVQGPIKERAQQNNGNFNPNTNELERIDFLLNWVIWLNIPVVSSIVAYCYCSRRTWNVFLNWCCF